jgi:hypothetical protein
LSPNRRVDGSKFNQTNGIAKGWNWRRGGDSNP